MTFKYMHDELLNHLKTCGAMDEQKCIWAAA